MRYSLGGSEPFRSDIQILRAIAVILVVLYHAKIPVLKSGFLGVDIFFVISGFLVGRIVVGEIINRQFSFRRFYVRRAWRLLPSAYVVFLFTVLFSPFFLTRNELQDLFWQVIGAVTFTSNIILWNQSGYFSGEASLKPLLHTWSLAIEEQFYIFLPVFLVLLRGKTRFYFVSIAALLSFTLAVYLRDSVSATFFLLPTRAWELLLGVVIALMFHRNGLLATPKFLYVGSFTIVLMVPFFELFSFHPGPQAALLCFATALILASQPRNFSGQASQVLLYIGAISYSLYLVHWPLFAFYNNMTFIVPWSTFADAVVRVGILFCSLTLAALLNRCIENRFRSGSDLRISKILLVSSAPAIIIVSLVALSPTQALSVKNTSYPGSSVCETSGRFTLEAACKSEGTPRILVWGDSFAMHLVPGLADGKSSLKVGVAHAARSACGPFIGVAQTKTAGGYNREWSEACIRFNDSVIEALQASSGIETVVLSSVFSYLTSNPEGVFARNRESGKIEWQSVSFDLAVQALSGTVEQLRAAGKRVVLVAPPPSGSFDMGRCGHRLVQELKSFGVDQVCRFDGPNAVSPPLGPAQLLAVMSDRFGVEVIYLHDVTCSSSGCESVIDGVPLYSDSSHLSREGSIWIAEKMDLRKVVWELAR